MQYRPAFRWVKRIPKWSPTSPCILILGSRTPSVGTTDCPSQGSSSGNSSWSRNRNSSTVVGTVVGAGASRGCCTVEFHDCSIHLFILSEVQVPSFSSRLGFFHWPCSRALLRFLAKFRQLSINSLRTLDYPLRWVNLLWVALSRTIEIIRWVNVESYN